MIVYNEQKAISLNALSARHRWKFVRLETARSQAIKIKEIACYRADLPVFDGEYVMSHNRVVRSLASTVVRVTAEDGTVGYAEACTLGGNYMDGFPGSLHATVAELAPVVLEANVFEADTLVTRMDAALIGHLPGKAVIDNAMWDLRGKLLGQPVARLLGGVQQSTFGTFTAVGLGHPAEMAEKVGRYAEHGFRHWQLKLGNDPLQDADRVHAVVDVLPENSSFLTSDANAGWTVAQTLRFLGAVEGVETYIEQPCRTVAELERVRRHTDRPMLVDESVKEPADMLSVVGLGLADALNLKPTRVGGLTKAAKIRDICVAAGVMILVDEPMGADLASGATVQLAATIPAGNFLSASFFSHEGMPASYRPAGGNATGPTVIDGDIHWNDAPGLGVEVDESVFGAPTAVYSLQ
ncbi:L-alanine-DL-glutamate epimerase [Actinomadura madurae]|uniref:L-alanine-DL-glutamate epimerase n=1 Tax=Actinomadura madurae TaxID=1993 RepID=A0A1I5I4W3_9ACTN|nr:L-alanine-DL-glutamate epimerase [Actinomadura madurae]